MPGAGTSVLVEQLLPRCRHLILNDISDEALDKLRKRIGDDRRVSWLHRDITRPLPPGIPAVDIWIDRATLHFLLEETRVIGYFKNLGSRLCDNGHVLLAECAADGAPKCAGLELHRYSAAEMGERLGPGFALLKEERHIYINPYDDPRHYVYALFNRNSGGQTG